MRVVLTEAKRLDMDFDEAWGLALRTIPRGDVSVPAWRRQFQKDKDHWRACYLGLRVLIFDA